MSNIFKDLGFMHQGGSLAAPDCSTLNGYTVNQLIDSVIPQVLDQDVDGVMTINSSAFIKPTSINMTSINDIFSDNSCIVTYPFDSNTRTLDSNNYSLATDSYTKLLLNGSLTDSSGNNKVGTVYGNTILSSSQIVNNINSIYFDGNGDYITYPAATDFVFGIGDFTIETFLYPQTGQGMIFDNINAGISGNTAGRIAFYYNNSQLCYYMNGSGYVGSKNLVLNVWSHVAIQRSNGIITMFINGETVYSASNSGNITMDNCTIGKDMAGGGTLSIQGYIDGLRISKGIARYSNNFIPSGLYNATPYNITYGLGKFGNAAVFNGTNSKIVTNLSGNYYSLNMWVYLANPVTSASAYNLLATWNKDLGGTWDAMSFGSTSSLTTGETFMLNFNDVGNTNNRIYYITDNILAGWNMMTIQWNGTSWEIYINGSKKTVYSYGTQIYRPMSLLLGSRQLNDIFFNGSIDQVRVFNKSLTQNEINKLYLETEINYTKQPLVISQDPTQNNWKKVTIKSFSSTGNISVNSNVLTPKTTGLGYIIYDDLYPNSRSLTLDYTGSLDHLEITTYI